MIHLLADAAPAAKSCFEILAQPVATVIAAAGVLIGARFAYKGVMNTIASNIAKARQEHLQEVVTAERDQLQEIYGAFGAGCTSYLFCITLLNGFKEDNAKLYSGEHDGIHPDILQFDKDRVKRSWEETLKALIAARMKAIEYSSRSALVDDDPERRKLAAEAMYAVSLISIGAEGTHIQQVSKQVLDTLSMLNAKIDSQFMTEFNRVTQGTWHKAIK